MFDREDSSANTLNAAVLEEFDKVLTELESQRPAGLVIRSAKKSGFIAGADVNEFRGATDPAVVEATISRAHAVIDRLEALRVPSVAVIHGFCLGGGLEVALACQSRIAISNARFGFPEVMLGLHPGLGGTARFTRLVNPMQAMTLMLTGRTIDARRAKGLGPVLSATELLKRNELTLSDIETWELNEAFATQVLGCLAAWNDEKFCREILGLDGAAGEIDREIGRAHV